MFRYGELNYAKGIDLPFGECAHGLPVHDPGMGYYRACYLYGKYWRYFDMRWRGALFDQFFVKAKFKGI